MTGIHLRPELTEAQRRALRWLHNRGGEGVFNRHQVLLARGELAAVMRATWNALAAVNPPCVSFSDNKGFKRILITPAGTAIALTFIGPEADTVEED